MNKYQEKALALAGVHLSEFGETVSNKTNLITKRLQVENDSVLVFGDRDIYSKDYTLRLRTNNVVKVELLIEDKWVALETSNFKYEVSEFDGRTTRMVEKNYNGAQAVINLDKRPEKIKLILPGNVCDDVIIDVKYDLMTEEEYWKVQNSPETLRKNMEVTYRTGEDLVNIYWKHAKENVVALVRIDLFMGDQNDPQLMGKYKENDEVFFKSITGLAYGKYCFKLYQFDKDNNEIASTDYISFSISKPTSDSGNNGGSVVGRQGRVKHTVVIG